MKVVNTKKVKCMTNRARRRRKRKAIINWTLFFVVNGCMSYACYWLYASGTLRTFLNQFNLDLQL